MRTAACNFVTFYAIRDIRCRTEGCYCHRSRLQHSFSGCIGNDDVACTKMLTVYVSVQFYYSYETKLENIIANKNGYECLYFKPIIIKKKKEK